MLDSTEPAVDSRSGPRRRFEIDWRWIAGVLLLVAAAAATWLTIEGLESRRKLRTDLAEISHARYGLLNASRWVEKLVPILETSIDKLDLTGNEANLRPMVQKALYRLLDDVKAKMSAPSGNPPAAGGGGFLSAGNPMIVNMIVGALRPHVPEYADVVLAELGKQDTKDAIKKYIKSVLADGAKTTFGDVDMTAYSAILKKYGCADGVACQQELGRQIREADAQIWRRCGTALGATALGFVLLMAGRPKLRRRAAIVLLLFSVVLLVGGVLTPMLEVEAKISQLKMTFLGTPIEFADQSLYFQSKSVLEVFRALVDSDRPDMWVVGVLVLMFSVVFPILKLIASSFYLYKPDLLRKSRIARFFALESSKWSMADVMALAIFMTFVAFNGLIPNTMAGLQGTGAQIAIPTNSSKILPGYFLFIGFCMASLFLSRKLGRGIAMAESADKK